MPVRMLIRYGFATLLLGAVLILAWMLIGLLTTERTNEGLAALLGGLVGAVGMALKDVVKDLYTPDDGEGGNGHAK